MVKKRVMFLRLLAPSLVPKAFGVLFFGFSALLPILIFIFIVTPPFNYSNECFNKKMIVA